MDAKYTDINYIRNNPDEKWSLFWLSCNRQITVKDIESLVLHNTKNSWNWNKISAYIDIKEVIANPHKPWDKVGLMCNNGITDKILEFFDAGLLKHLQKNIPKFKYRTDITLIFVL